MRTATTSSRKNTSAPPASRSARGKTASAPAAATRSRRPTTAAPAESDLTMMEGVDPGPEHDQLATCAGTWDVAFTCWMREGDPPVSAACSSLIETVCDGRYLRETVSGEFADKPFLGTGTTGYDRAAKHYVATWYDNMNTGIVYMTGSRGKEGTITYHGSMVCPQQGPIDLRQVVEQESDDGRFIVTMFSRKKGEKGKKNTERKTMELVYTRRRP